METIIVATDYSEEANNAMEFAAALAAGTGAGILLFNSFQLPAHLPPTAVTSAEKEKMLAENRAFLEDLAMKIAAKYGITAEAQTSLTFVAEELDKLVRDYDAGLVVMGMWKNAQDDAIFGNTTTFVIDHASFPVLVVPEGLQFKDINKILYSWDPEIVSASGSLSIIKNLARTFSAQVQVLHVMKEPEAEKGKGNPPPGPGQIPQGIRPAYRITAEEGIAEGIERGVLDYGADLLVMVPRKNRFRDALNYESHTRAMALKTRVPLLAIPNPE